MRLSGPALLSPLLASAECWAAPQRLRGCCRGRRRPPPVEPLRGARRGRCRAGRRHGPHPAPEALQQKRRRHGGPPRPGSGGGARLQVSRGGRRRAPGAVPAGQGARRLRGPRGAQVCRSPRGPPGAQYPGGRGCGGRHGRAGVALLPPFPLVGSLSHFLRELAVARPGARGARPSAAVGERRRAPCLAFVCG